LESPYRRFQAILNNNLILYKFHAQKSEKTKLNPHLGLKYFVFLYPIMSATVNKTINILTEAARVLFTRNGYDRTTMTDIAREAKKGRRTLYVHFPSKEALLRKVIEMELNRILDVLRSITNKDIPADRKIMEFVISRLNNVRHTIFRNGSLRADFTRFYLKIDSIRRKYDKIEICLIREILLEGREQGLFKFDDADVMSTIIHYSIKGLETPYIRGQVASNVDVGILEHHARQLILRGLGMNI
jgi:AcrR family transcriptional regulator